MKRLSYLFFPIILTVYYIDCLISNAISTSFNSLNSMSESLGSLSTSLESISKSSKSISESSSKDEGKKEQSLYIQDISYLTKFALMENLASEDYIREINKLARNYGIVDWQKNPNTYEGIGRGLKISNISLQETHEFVESLSNPEMKKFILLGYNRNHTKY